MTTTHTACASRELRRARVAGVGGAAALVATAPALAQGLGMAAIPLDQPAVLGAIGAGAAVILALTIWLVAQAASGKRAKATSVAASAPAAAGKPPAPARPSAPVMEAPAGKWLAPAMS